MRLAHDLLPLRVRQLALAALLSVCAILLASTLQKSETDAFISAEVKFADASMTGLSIVPASCPSSPHYLSECTDTTGGGTPSGGTPGGGCLPGYVWNGTQCVVSNCPLGYVLQNGSCVFVACPSGYTFQGGQCVTCVLGYYCSGSNLYRGIASPASGGGDGGGACTPGAGAGEGGGCGPAQMSCTSTFVQACAYGCSSGACNPPPPPQIGLTVAPTLVRKDDTVNVSWTTQNVASCTVTGTNGDGAGGVTGTWSGVTGNKTSSPIQAQTIYTLSCIALDGSTPSQSKTVNLVPSFCEPGVAGCPL